MDRLEGDKMKGFTLVELLLVMGIFAILAAFTTINLIQPQTKSSLDSTINMLIADLKQQQVEAMIGEAASQFGIQFDSSSYTIIKDDFTVSLDSNLSLSNNFPLSRVVFNKRSGELENTGSITITDSGGNAKTINVNKLGVVNIQ